MIKQPGDLLAWLWVIAALFAFGLFVVAFFRLFRQAWKMPERRSAIMKVVNIQPRRDGGWPNQSREADMIVWGAALGLVLFTVAGIWLFSIRR